MTMTMKESVIVGAACILILLVSMVINLKAIDTQEDLFGASLRDVSAIKESCEKSLPRDQECVMVFDFVPVKKEKTE